MRRYGKLRGFSTNPVSVFLLLPIFLYPAASSASDFQLLADAEIQTLLKGLEVMRYPHGQSYKGSRLWNMTTNENGTWDADRRGKLTYGKWHVEDNALGVDADDHDTQYPPKVGCFRVGIDSRSGEVALIIQDRSDPFVIEDLAGDRLAAIGGPKQPSAEMRAPALLPRAADDPIAKERALLA